MNTKNQITISSNSMSSLRTKSLSLIMVLACLGTVACSQRGKAESSSANNQQSENTDSHNNIDIIKQSVINQLSIKYKMNPGDLRSSSIQLAPLTAGGAGQTKYHVTGSFVLSWTQPRNTREEISVVVRSRICAVVSPCPIPFGFRHTIYMDLFASMNSTTGDIVLTGNDALDETIAQQKKEVADEAEAVAQQQRQEQAEAQQRAQEQAAEQASQQAAAKARFALAEQQARREQLITSFKQHQQQELQQALSDLSSRQDAESNRLNAELGQQQQQLQSARMLHTTGQPYTYQMEQQETAPLQQIAVLQRQVAMLSAQHQQQRYALMANARQRQAQELNDFIAKLDSGTEAGSTASNASTTASPSQTPIVVQDPLLDCSNPKTPTQSTICGNAGLVRLDGQMGRAYQRILQSGNPADVQLIENDQHKWIIARDNKCGPDIQCIKSEIQQRVYLLSQYLN